MVYPCAGWGFVMELSELHNCPKSEGNIVGISIDALGVERCGYCNAVVKYSEFFKRKYPEMWAKATVK